MPRESFEKEVEALLGKSFSDDEVPSYPGRIYRYDGSFITGFPHFPAEVAEVRFREANYSERGDFTIVEARAIDTSNPEDTHGEWVRYRPYQDTSDQ